MSFHRSAMGAALFLLAREYLPWSDWPTNETQIFEAAGVSLRDAEAAKRDLLDRIQDLLWNDPEILAMAAEAVSEVWDPEYEGFDLEAHEATLKYYAEYEALALEIEEKHAAKKNERVPQAPDPKPRPTAKKKAQIIELFPRR